MISDATKRAINAYRDAMLEVGGRYGTLDQQLNQCVAARAALIQAIEAEVAEAHTAGLEGRLRGEGRP